MNKLCIVIASFFLFLSQSFATAKSGTIELEEKMDLFEKIVELQVRLEMVQTSNFWNKDKEINSMAFVDTLWKKGWDSTRVEDHELVRESLKKIDFSKFELADKVRLFLMDQSFDKTLVTNSEFMKDIYESSREGKLTRRELYTLLNYQAELEGKGFEDIFKDLYENYEEDVSPYKDAQNIANKGLSKSTLKDIIFNNLDLSDFGRGKYSFGPKLFMLCRHDRNYPCLMVMKDSRNQLVKNRDGRIWTQKSLGLARKDRAYNVKNGYTPSGVYTMDSVMPEANKQTLYGKYRRIILNFIPPSKGEVQIKKLLPKSSEAENWWKQGVVARDVGRNLLRIHGTGLINTDPSSTHYPFVKTSGCIAQRENKYDGKTFRDQRNLLDKMMEASGLRPSFNNETHIRGLLYVVEINGDKKPVEYSDIENFLDL